MKILNKISNNILILIILSILFLSSNLNSNLFSAPILKWAADSEGNAPFVFQDPRVPSRLIGFELDIITEICKEMGYEAVFVQNQWDGLIPGIERGDYDVAINGIEVTNDRELVVNFSTPYYTTFEQLVVRNDNNSIFTLADLAGKKVGTLKGAIAERILNAQGNIDVKTYDSESSSFLDLKNSKLDAVLIDSPPAVYFTGWNFDLKMVGPPIGEIVYGIVVKKGNEELLNKINIAISKMQTTGKLREILDSWNLWNPLMAVRLNDKSAAKVKPFNYEYFISSQTAEMTLLDKIMRYLTFLPMIAKAALTTIEISIFSMIVAIVVGLLLALMRVYAPKPFSSFAILFIEVMRGTPLLIQLYFIYFALPTFGINISPFMAAIIGLGLNYSAYEAENYRAGLFSVPRGQMEAAISLGMTRNQALKHIIIPQAIRLVIPPITNDFISLLKDSSLVSVITMVELTKLYSQLAATYFDYTGIGIIIAIAYLLIGLPFVKLSKMAENHFALDKRRNSI
ncbi:MAG: ABC transporter substrate-binding protein/permease [Candidatus Kapaibacteriota bacterium]|jgi:polar amino acid transport system substrate-binding protein